MKTAIRFLIIGACLTMAGTSWGAQITNYFRAAAVTQTMVDGTPVVMWGFAKDSGPQADGTFLRDGVATVPGPKLELPPGNHELWIYLENTLPEPVSIVIPGLPTALGDPVRNAADGRATSLTHETAPRTTAIYTWRLNPGDDVTGTYLYHSGTHPAVQVQMGLYGALTKRQAANRAYPGVATHNSEATLLFSEVDPVLHAAVAGGKYALPNDVDNEPIGWSGGGGMSPGDVDVDGDGVYDAGIDTDNPPQGWATGGAMSPGDVDHNLDAIFDTYLQSTTEYGAKYFLINGRSYTAGFEAQGLQHIVAGNIPNNNAQQNVLLRFLNAGLDSHIPILNGEHLKVIAEDGKPYTYLQNSYAPQLSALKTLDAFWNPTRAGTFPLYDRRLDLVNNTASGPGGMLTYVAVSQTRNGGLINIPANTPAAGANGSTYPSQVTVSGLQGVVSKVSVRINGFYHPRPSDVDIVLVGPANTAVSSVLFMSDVGGATAIPSTLPVTLTFDDGAATSLTSATLLTGTYKPTDLGGAADRFVSPAPTSGWGSTLSVFNNTNPNGTWRLYVRDNGTGPATGTGSIASWNLIITPRPQ